jgi:hypothetical protein
MIAAEAGLGRFSTVAFDGTKITLTASIDANHGKRWSDQRVAGMVADSGATDRDEDATGLAWTLPIGHVKPCFSADSALHCPPPAGADAASAGSSPGAVAGGGPGAGAGATGPGITLGPGGGGAIGAGLPGNPIYGAGPRGCSS